MPTYLDSDFDSTLQREVIISGQTQFSELDSDMLIESLDASKIRNGTMSSENGRTKVDLDNGTIIFGDGLVDRVRLGKMDDGSYGLIIKDIDGNVLLNITGDINLIQSKTQKMQIDLTEEQARWYDELHLRILIGKALGRF